MQADTVSVLEIWPHESRFTQAIVLTILIYLFIYAKAGWRPQHEWVSRFAYMSFMTLSICILHDDFISKHIMICVTSPSYSWSSSWSLLSVRFTNYSLHKYVFFELSDALELSNSFFTVFLSCLWLLYLWYYNIYSRHYRNYIIKTVRFCFRHNPSLVEVSSTQRWPSTSFFVVNVTFQQVSPAYQAYYNYCHNVFWKHARYLQKCITILRYLVTVLLFIYSREVGRGSHKSVLCVRSW